MLKTLLIEGAQDLGTPGPDYTFGFGLANAQASVDLIRADGANPGSRFRVASVPTGGKMEFPFTLTAAQNVRVTLGWSDPENVLGADELADKTLIDDLDLTIVDPNGNTVLPWKLNGSTPTAAATRDRNSVDNTEQVEISSAVPGNYKIVVTGTSVDAKFTPQEFVLASNAALGAPVVACSDEFEPNDTSATAFGNLGPNASIAARICSATDLDFYKILVTRSGNAQVSVLASDTPLKLTLTGDNFTSSTNIAAGASGTISHSVGTGSGLNVPATPFVIKVEPNGTVGASGSYALGVSYSHESKTRGTKH
jgi:hypothetical protein